MNYTRNDHHHLCSSNVRARLSSMARAILVLIITF
jgi:hypothetical protein